jgi:limonene-1,2-epoxide hydrolase
VDFLTTEPQSERARLAALCATQWFIITPELAEEWFTPDCIYENRLAAHMQVQGPEKIYLELNNYRDVLDRFEGTLLNIAECGDAVLLEREELTFLKDGTSCMVPVMDSFQFRGNKIFAWREYWDLATLTNSIGLEAFFNPEIHG